MGYQEFRLQGFRANVGSSALIALLPSRTARLLAKGTDKCAQKADSLAPTSGSNITKILIH